MLILEDQSKGIWTLQSSTPAEFGMLKNMSKALKSGDVFGAHPQEGPKEVNIIISPANGFPPFTPRSFILSGTMESDRENMKKLGCLAFKCHEGLYFQSSKIEEETAFLVVCGAFCSICANPISKPELIDSCTCDACNKSLTHPCSK